MHLIRLRKIQIYCPLSNFNFGEYFSMVVAWPDSPMFIMRFLSVVASVPPLIKGQWIMCGLSNYLMHSPGKNVTYAFQHDN